MITILKWSIVNASQLEGTLFNQDAVIEALERQVATYKKQNAELKETLEMQKGVNRQNAELLARLEIVKQQNAELEKEVAQLRAATFSPLPAVSATKNKGGRPRKTSQNGATNHAV